MKPIQKLTIAGMFIALGVALSAFYIPIGASKCFPIQHMINVLAGVVLGPWYAVGMAFATSAIRVMMGTGSLLAFPGSMIGALCCGLLYKKFGKLWAGCAGELLGTGVLGALACYPIANFVMGNEAAVFAYVVPFVISSFGGCVIAFFGLGVMKKTGVLQRVA